MPDVTWCFNRRHGHHQCNMQDYKEAHCKRYSNPITGLNRPWGFQEVEALRFQDSQHMKVVRLPALCTGHQYPLGNIPGTHFCYRLSKPQGHSSDRRIMSMKNSKDIIGNRTHDFPACSAVPQPTASPRAPGTNCNLLYYPDDDHISSWNISIMNNTFHINAFVGHIV